MDELLLKAKAGDRFAMDEIIEKCEPIVKNKAKRYYIPGGDKEDVFQEGRIGVYNAIKYYQEERDRNFRSFVNLCIERRIATAVRVANYKKRAILNEAISLQMETNKERLKISTSEPAFLEEVLGDGKLDPIEQLIEKENLKEIMELPYQIGASKLEIEVIKLKAQEKTYDEIAEILGCKKKSVDNAIDRFKKRYKNYKEAM